MTDEQDGSEVEGRETTERPAGTADAAAELFREIELFQLLDEESIADIVEIAEPLALEAGEVLFEQGDRSEAMHVLREGVLEVRAQTELGEEVDLATLEAGEVVGEMSIIEGGERSATVEAVADCRLLSVSRSDFDRLRRQRRRGAYELLLGLARVLGQRRRDADTRIRRVFEEPEEYVDAFEEQVFGAIGRLRKG
ncbi:MAG: cyclic nucleotide-binding domain-containing protein [Bradymonadaceae bacterium]